MNVTISDVLYEMRLGIVSYPSLKTLYLTLYRSIFTLQYLQADVNIGLILVSNFLRKRDSLILVIKQGNSLKNQRLKHGSIKVHTPTLI